MGKVMNKKIWLKKTLTLVMKKIDRFFKSLGTDNEVGGCIKNE